MLTVYSEDHRLHHGTAELIDGKLVPPFEKPERAEIVLSRVREAGLGEVRPPQDFGTAPLARVHAENFLTFLETAWEAWVAAHGAYDALPLAWPIRGLRSDREPEAIDGKLRYFSFDAGTPITAGTWRAITASANVALTGRRWSPAASGRPSRSAARRATMPRATTTAATASSTTPPSPPRPSATAGPGKVAILDVDYHHGNGTQSIFYDRGDVFFASLHGHPARSSPTSWATTTRPARARAKAATANYPAAWGTGFGPWSAPWRTPAAGSPATAPRPW